MAVASEVLTGRTTWLEVSYAGPAVTRKRYLSAMIKGVCYWKRLRLRCKRLQFSDVTSLESD